MQISQTFYSEVDYTCKKKNYIPKKTNMNQSDVQNVRSTATMCATASMIQIHVPNAA